MSGSLGRGPSDSTPVVVTTTTLLSAYDGPPPSESLPLPCRLGLHKWVYRDRYDKNAEDFVLAITEARCERRCKRYPVWSRVNVEQTRIPSAVAIAFDTDVDRALLFGTKIGPQVPERCPACEGHEGAYHVLSCEHRRDS